MALLRCDFFSEVLEVSTSMTVLLPQASAEQIGIDLVSTSSTNGDGSTSEFPVLYLLHGLSDDSTAWLRYTSIERYAAPLGLAVVMPQVQRSFYADEVHGERFFTFLSDELPEVVQRFFRVSRERQDTFVAGLSMGGYGALSYAARHPDTFDAAASFSGALEIGSEDAWGVRSANAARWRAHLPISIASRLRSLALVEIRTGNGRPGPLDRRGTQPGCPACSLERFLHPANVRLHRRLQALGIRHVWDDYGPGTHDWPYWRRDLRETLPGLERVLARS